MLALLKNQKLSPSGSSSKLLYWQETTFKKTTNAVQNSKCMQTHETAKTQQIF